MKLSSIAVSFILSISISIAQNAPTIIWKQNLGGSKGDTCTSIQQTADGGYILAGYSFSNDGDVSGNRTNAGNTTADFWVVKTNSSGNVEWQKSLGGTANEYASAIQQTADGGYVVAGYSFSNDADVTNNKGMSDCWIVKLNNAGSVEWQKSYGGTGVDVAFAIQQTLDGGYIVGCWSTSQDGDVTGNHGKFDYWILKLNNAGVIEWQKSLGGLEDDVVTSIKQTADGGYIAAGSAVSNNGDVTGNHGGVHPDMWIVKMTNAGIIEWQKSVGGVWEESAFSIDQTTDGGFIVGGFSNSDAGDISGHHGRNTSSDACIFKLGSAGNIQWQKSLGGTNYEAAITIKQTTDGGYILTGFSNSADGDVSSPKGNTDFWVVKLDNIGDTVWKKNYGGTAFDEGVSIRQTNDGGFIVAGNSNSIDGDGVGNKGRGDFLILKLSPETILPLTLLTFSGAVNENNVLLRWETTTELSSDVFYLEKSNDGVHFNNIGKIDAKASNLSITSYDYQDMNILRQNSSKLYYRLKIVKRDGSFTYSKVIVLNFNAKAVFTVSPNPAKDFITVTGAGLRQISLLDLNGKILLSKTVLTAGDNKLNLSNIPGNTYIITLTNNVGQTYTEKIVIR